MQRSRKSFKSRSRFPPQPVAAIVDMCKRYLSTVQTAKGAEPQVEEEQSRAELQFGSTLPAWLVNLTQTSDRILNIKPLIVHFAPKNLIYRIFAPPSLIQTPRVYARLPILRFALAYLVTCNRS